MILIDKKLLLTCAITNIVPHDIMLVFPDFVNITYMNAQPLTFTTMYTMVTQLTIRNIIEEHAVAFIINNAIVRSVAKKFYISSTEIPSVIPIVAVSMDPHKEINYIRLEEAIR